MADTPLPNTPHRPPSRQALADQAAEGQSELSELREQAEVTQQLISRDESATRQRIATRFVNIYFILLALLLVGIPVYNILVVRLTQNQQLIIKLTDIVQTYSAVVGPTLGFVIAYYFKSKNER